MMFVRYTQRRNGATLQEVTGNEIGRWRLTKRQRARLAASILDGRTQLTKLNEGQVATLLKVSVSYTRKMRRPQSALQLQQAAE
jgi:hypothetical protein